tara:strand:+ start:2112 stop:4070 length:1959 start_codon:yes stop_codon:yes gene_type:complete
LLLSKVKRVVVFCATLTFSFSFSVSASTTPIGTSFSGVEQRFEQIVQEYRSENTPSHKVAEDLEALLLMMDDSNVALKARVNSMLIQALIFSGHLKKAEQIYEVYNAVGLSVVPAEARLRMMNSMLYAYWRLSDMDALYEVQENMLSTIRGEEQISPVVKAASTISLAQNFFKTKNYARGLELLYLGRRMLISGEEIGSEIRDRLMANVQREQIAIMSDLGSFDVAKIFAEQSLKEVKDRSLTEQEITYYFWGYQLMREGLYEDANQYFQKSIDMALKSGDKNRAYDAMNLYAVSLFFEGKHDKAMQVLSDFVAHFKEQDPAMIYMLHEMLFDSLHQTLGTSPEKKPEFISYVMDDGYQDVRWALEREDLFFLQLNALTKQNEGNALDNVEAQAALYEYHATNYQDKLRGTSYQKLISDEAALSELNSTKLQERVDLQNGLINERNRQANYILGLGGAGSATVGLVFLLLIREKRNRKKYSEMAMVDPLTNSPNRRAITEFAEESMSGGRSGCLSSVGIALIDLDHFKSINDNYGHDVGDMVLRKFYDICSPLLREGDKLGRYGGEEFLMVLPDATEDDITSVFDRLQTALKATEVHVNGKTLPIAITMSMGATIHPRNEDKSNVSFDKVVTTADKGVYQAKSSGRDQLVIA